MRVNVVTGAASGIGKSTKELLEARGEKVIGVDLRNADVNVDLSTPEGRAQMVTEVTQLSGGTVDAVFSIAGVGGQTALCASVNYFGMRDVLTSLRPLLEKSAAPRAVLVASVMSMYPIDEQLMAAIDANDEPAACKRAEELGVEDPQGNGVYNTTKRAIALWVRRNAISDDWSGKGITLNAVAPGMIRTPLVQDFDNEEGRKVIDSFLKMPLNSWAEPEEVAELMAFLNAPSNRHITGQCVFIDGGTDITMRGDSTWQTPVTTVNEGPCGGLRCVPGGARTPIRFPGRGVRPLCSAEAPSHVIPFRLYRRRRDLSVSLQPDAIPAPARWTARFRTEIVSVSRPPHRAPPACKEHHAHAFTHHFPCAYAHTRLRRFRRSAATR